MKREYKPTIVHPVMFSPGEKIAFKNRDIFDRQTSQLKGLYNLAILEIPRPCSDQWRKYYFGVLVGDPMDKKSPCNHFGYFNQGKLHKEYKDLFNFGNSTTKFSNRDWKDYTERIKIWLALRHKFNAPDPNQVDFLG